MNKFTRAFGAGVALLGAMIAPAAFAEVPGDVTSAITGAGQDAATIGGAVLVVIVGIAAFKWLRRAL